MSSKNQKLAILPSIVVLFSAENAPTAEDVQALFNTELEIAVAAAVAPLNEEIEALSSLKEEFEALKLEHDTCHETIELLKETNVDLSAELEASKALVLDIKKETKDVFTPGTYKSKVTKYVYRIKKGFKQIIIPGMNGNKPVPSSEVIQNSEMMEKLIKIQYGGIERVKN